MQPLTRRGARLAQCSQIRSSSVPRQRLSRHRRAFHTSVQRTSNSRPPNNGHSDNHTPVSDWREQSRATGNESSKQETAAGEQEKGGEVRNENKSMARRTLRQRRLNEVPKPPPIPEWFLRENVSLVEDRQVKGVDMERVRAIRCVDTETGHTLFTVPYYQDGEARKETDKGSGDGQSGVGQQPRESPDGSSTAFTPPTKKDLGRLEWHLDPMRWVLLEAESSVRAALSLANDPQRTSSVATDNVDLSLQCPDPNSHDGLDGVVQDLALLVGADVMQLDANDFAELTEEYVGQGQDGPGTFSHLGYEVFDGYVANSLRPRPSPFQAPKEEDEENERDEDEEEEDENYEVNTGSLPSLGELTRALRENRGALEKMLGGKIVGIMGAPPVSQGANSGQRAPRRSVQPSSYEMNRDDARLDALFDNLLEAPKEKRAATKSTDAAPGYKHQAIDPTDHGNWQKFMRYTTTSPSDWLPSTAKSLLAPLGSILQGNDPTKFPYQLIPDQTTAAEATSPDNSPRKLIVHVRDLRDICNSKLGDTVIRRLSKVVRKRRRSGDQIVIVGTTAQDVPGPIRLPGDHADDFPFRVVNVPPSFNFSENEDLAFGLGMPDIEERSLAKPAYNRILEINLRHLQTMLRRLRPDDGIDLSSAHSRKQMDLAGMHFLTERVLPMDNVQRLALVAVGLSRLHARSDSVEPVHIALATFVTSRADHVNMCWRLQKSRSQFAQFSSAAPGGEGKNTSGSKAEEVKKSCNQHETRLLTGVVDSNQIKTRFEDVHAPVETIDSLKSLTSLSLLRPEAFKYGVLANDRLPGLLLYGPPGTGKTLLAKAVAKESKATVLEVSGAQIYEKYVGEGEKMVRAVFSLAKKLSPCVVFIDEADAIFGSRSNAGNRNTHREIINQFLREWDGMDDHGVFMMVASNRPFDLDDAVLRRLPRRLLVDLPVAKDRESILGIHLRDESLDSSVSLNKLAEQTPLYSGSDLKNLAVAAALACVREENDLAARHKDDKEFKLPEKRTLTSQHFDKALAEISASISEDMSSLTAIRKFDEQYGDRKGRRKKTGYGFGALDDAVDESAARVRQASSPSQPPPP